jgi:hypothetical protein
VEGPSTPDRGSVQSISTTSFGPLRHPRQGRHSASNLKPFMFRWFALVHDMSHVLSVSLKCKNVDVRHCEDVRELMMSKQRCSPIM